MKEQNRKLKVFLCHSKDDKTKVRELYHRLVADGFDAWLDEEKLLPGQEWDLEIRKAVRQSDVVVVCLSNSSTTKAGYVQKEIRFALDVADEQPEGAVFIIPARFEECEVPKRLGKWQWVDLFNQNGYMKVAQSLRIRANSQGIDITRFSGNQDSTDTQNLSVNEIIKTGLSTNHARFLYQAPSDAIGVVERSGSFLRFIGPDEFTFLIPFFDTVDKEIAIHMRVSDITLDDVILKDKLPVKVKVKTFYYVDVRNASLEHRPTILRFGSGSAWEEMVKINVESIVRGEFKKQIVDDFIEQEKFQHIRHSLGLSLIDRVKDFGVVINPNYGVSLEYLEPRQNLDGFKIYTR